MRSVRNENGSGRSSPGCNLGLVVVDRAAVESRRGAGLEPRQPQAESLKASAEAGGGGFAHASAGMVASPTCSSSVQEGAGAEDDGAGAIGGPVGDADADDPRPSAACLDQQVLDRLLPQGEARLLFARGV